MVVTHTPFFRPDFLAEGWERHWGCVGPFRNSHDLTAPPTKPRSPEPDLSVSMAFHIPPWI